MNQNDQSRDGKITTADTVREQLRRRGFYYCLAAACCFTLTFFLVRCLAGQANPDWILCVKESVTVVVTLPIILVQVIRRKYSWPPLRTIGWLLAAGFFCEFLGARLRIWSYAVLGLVVANPLIQISTILETLLLGAIFLNEKISPQKWVAFFILTAAIIIISASNTGMTPLLQDSFLTSHVGWGVTLALLTGLGHALFYVIMRKISKKEDKDAPTKVPLSLAMFTICLIGVLTGGGFVWAEGGLDAFMAPPPICWGLCLAAGVAGMFGFLLLNLGLRYASASKVTMISVAQLVLLTLLGAFVLHEPTNVFVWIGLVLVCIGIVLTRDLD